LKVSDVANMKEIKATVCQHNPEATLAMCVENGGKVLSGFYFIDHESAGTRRKLFCMIPCRWEKS